MPQQISKTRILIRSLRAELEIGCPPILVGGLASNSLDNPLQSTEADGWSADTLRALGNFQNG